MINYNKKYNAYEIQFNNTLYIPKANFNKEDLRRQLHDAIDYGVYRQLLKEAEEKKFI